MSISKIDKIKNGIEHCLHPYAIPHCDGCLYNRKHGAIQTYCDCRSQLLTDAKNMYNLLVKTAMEARKMRLIDGDALLSAYDAAHKGPPGGARKLIEQAPTIDAVPLEPLCEWLAENASYVFGGYKNTWKFEARHWEYTIKEWMESEGLDAAD